MTNTCYILCHKELFHVVVSKLEIMGSYDRRVSSLVNWTASLSCVPRTRACFMSRYQVDD